jgi:hypothetical protein
VLGQNTTSISLAEKAQEIELWGRTYTVLNFVEA